MGCRRRILLQLALLLIHYVDRSLSSPYRDKLGLNMAEATHYATSPSLSPSTIQAVVPIQAPMPIMPFTYDRVPKLSGLCAFNFSSVESILKVTATDCWSLLAPYLSNVVCCPQFEATLVILVGQYGNNTGMLALNETHAEHCISDVEKILESNGATENLHNICSINSTNLIHASCPVLDINEVERVLDTSLLLASCKKIDEANECCNQVCQNAITTAAGKLALRENNITETEEAEALNDCKKIVLTWLASKLEPSSANRVLRLLSSCNINKACPLVLPDIKNVSKECRNSISRTSCCGTLESYMSRLQEQSFITHMQALNCAASLGLKLQNDNVSTNIYNLCHTKLKDFSLQVDSKVSGCLFPSLPSDITFDRSSGIGFTCDLNDNVEAPWPSGPFVPDSSCNKTTILPEVPKATSSQRGLHIGGLMFVTLFSVLLFL